MKQRKRVPRFDDCTSRYNLINDLSELAKDTRASIAPTVGVAISVLLIACGSAIDYARILSARSELQALTDQASLVSVKANGTHVDPNSIDYSRKIAEEWIINNNISGISVRNVNVYISEEDNLCVISEGDLSLAFGPLFNISTSPIEAESCASTGIVEVAFALDNSSSMIAAVNGTRKIDSLRNSLRAAIAALNPDRENPTVAISLVPFANSVNVGKHYRNATWMDRSGLSSTHWTNIAIPSGGDWTPKSRFELFDRMGIEWGGCVDERPYPFTTTDDPSSTSADALFVPTLDVDEAGEATGTAYYNYIPSKEYTAEKTLKGYKSVNSYLSDDGGSCVSGDVYSVADDEDSVSNGSGAARLCKYDGQKPADVESGVVGYKGNFLAYYPAGPNFSCTTKQLETLTTDVAALESLISAMSPNGETNLLTGFMWAWRTISPNGPFADEGASSGIGRRKPVEYGDNEGEKYIVLMTDGYNYWSKNPNSPYQSSSGPFGFYINNRLSKFGTYFMGRNVSGPTTEKNARSQIDAALLDACSNAKKSGVQIFSVGFSAPAAPIDDQGQYVLEECASSEQNYFLPQTSSDFSAAFSEISARIGSLRITK